MHVYDPSYDFVDMSTARISRSFWPSYEDLISLLPIEAYGAAKVVHDWRGLSLPVLGLNPLETKNIAGMTRTGALLFLVDETENEKGVIMFVWSAHNLVYPVLRAENAAPITNDDGDALKSVAQGAKSYSVKDTRVVRLVDLQNSSERS